MLIPSLDSSRRLTIQVNGELVLCDVAFLTAEIRITRLIPSSPLLLALHVEANIKAFASKRLAEQADNEPTTR